MKKSFKMRNTVISFFLLLAMGLLISTSMSCSNKRTTDTETPSGLVNKVKARKILIDGRKPARLDNEGLQSRFFLVRHAEKEKQRKDPGLLPEGKARAARLAAIFSDLSLRRVYSTNYQRTQLTAAPTAESMHLQIINYAPKGFADIFDQLLRQPPNGHYLLVGHSNSVPHMLNHLTGKEVYKSIPETDYDNFYVVSVYEDKRVAVLELKY